MSRKKNTSTVQIQNCVFEVIATNPLKEFTTPAVMADLKTVYGINPPEIVVWRAINRLKKDGLISLQSKVSRIKHYSVVSSTDISNLIDIVIGFPTVFISSINDSIGASTDDTTSDEFTVDSVDKVIGKIKDQDFDPLDYVDERYYNRIIHALYKNNVEESKEMVIVVLAIMGYCSAEDTTRFKSREIFTALNFLSKMTILCKLEILCNSFYMIRAEENNSGAEVLYRITMKPIDFGLNLDVSGVLRPLVISTGSLTEDEVTELVSGLDTPEEKVAGMTLTHEEIGYGFIAIYKRVEDDNARMLRRIEQLEKENVQLMDERNSFHLALKKANKDLVDLSSKNDELKIVKKNTPKTEITLRSMADLKNINVSKKLGL
jgi:hypothetical protein